MSISHLRRDGIIHYRWRNGAYAGEFGDAFISDTELEGGHSAPAIATLNRVINHILTTRRHQLTLLNDDDIKVVRRVCSDMDGAATICDLKEEASEAGSFIPFLENFLT